MPDPSDFDFRPDDPDIRAFVLRVRRRQGGRADPMVVHLDDVTAARTWHFTSLEDAFAEIRGALKLSGQAPPPVSKSH